MDTLMILGIILFIAGFILIAIEMVIPGFGAPGISGIACLIAGVFLTADPWRKERSLPLLCWRFREL